MYINLPYFNNYCNLCYRSVDVLVVLMILLSFSVYFAERNKKF